MRSETTTLTLGGAARIFFTQPSPWIIGAALAGSIVGLLTVWSWSWTDLIVPAIFVALQPFTEWNIHVFLLHFRPKKIGRLHIDPLVARKHREHHLDPKDVGLIFVPMPALLLLIGGLAAALVPTMPLGRGLSGLVAAYAILFTYEWTHYLIHSTYRPRHALYRYVWRAHRNHHFRNEHYWFGVTVHLADHVLGTFPEKTAVAVSPTARTLGIESDAA